MTLPFFQAAEFAIDYRNAATGKGFGAPSRWASSATKNYAVRLVDVSLLFVWDARILQLLHQSERRWSRGGPVAHQLVRRFGSVVQNASRKHAKIKREPDANRYRK